MTGLRHVKAKPAIFFGGLGEPLAHPNILDDAPAGATACLEA